MGIDNSIYYLGSDVKHNLSSLFALARKNGFRNQTSALGRRVESIAQHKSGSDFYILGSGPSILDLGPQEYRSISQSLSLGINFWILHDFRPDIYYVEGVDDAEGRDLWREQLQRKADIYSETITVVPSNYFPIYHPAEDLALLDRLFSKNLYWVKLLHTTGTSKLIVASIALSVRAGILRNYLRHFRGSLSIALDLAARVKGVKRIILLGVDLTNRRNFYHDLGVDYGAENRALSHTTVEQITGGDNLSIVDYIRVFDRLVLQPRGKQLLVGSEQSLLADFLPVWQPQ